MAALRNVKLSSILHVKTVQCQVSAQLFVEMESQQALKPAMMQTKRMVNFLSY